MNRLCKCNNLLCILHCFIMKRDAVCTSIQKYFGKEYRICNHQMYILKEITGSAVSFQNIRPKSQIRHKVTIHNIKMNPLCF